MALTLPPPRPCRPPSSLTTPTLFGHATPGFQSCHAPSPLPHLSIVIYPSMQVRSSELESELDSVRDEANRRISQLDSANQEQASLLQQHQSELHTRRKQVADLEAKLHSRSGALADHSERAKQLQQVCYASVHVHDAGTQKWLRMPSSHGMKHQAGTAGTSLQADCYAMHDHS